MTTEIKPMHLKLASILLELAHEKLSNHSCNDFELREHGFTAEECLELSKAMWVQNGSHEDEREFIRDDGSAEDWVLMVLLSELFGHAGAEPDSEIDTSAARIMYETHVDALGVEHCAWVGLNVGMRRAWASAAVAARAALSAWPERPYDAYVDYCVAKYPDYMLSSWGDRDKSFREMWPELAKRFRIAGVKLKG